MNKSASESNIAVFDNMVITSSIVYRLHAKMAILRKKVQNSTQIVYAKTCKEISENKGKRVPLVFRAGSGKN